MVRLIFAFSFLFLFGRIAAQEDESVKKSFKNIVGYLADDKLGGRNTGTPEEKMAAEYINAFFDEFQITAPAYAAEHYASFTFTDGYSTGSENFLSINNTEITPDHFFPLTYSSSAKAQAPIVYVADGIKNDGSKCSGKIVLMNLDIPSKIKPHTEAWYNSRLSERIKKFKKAGAAAIILYNNSGQFEKNYQRTTENLGLPVVYSDINAKDAKKLNGKNASLSTSIFPTEKIGTNVIGLIDNNADKTIILGAHYDHLGHGENGNALSSSKDVYNGADDNASGVAMLLELAKHLKEYNNPSFNYLFIAFSGEELGLFGSKGFVENHLEEVVNPTCMINFDMVGRLNQDKGLIINGVGTAKMWNDLLPKSDNFKITTTQSGIGPSDHSSFCLEKIPVLHFFTGSHEDYHKPTDDVEKINFEGMLQVYHYLIQLLDNIQANPAISYQEVTEDKESNKVSFAVTLGVIPDYSFSGKGLRIDGVSKGKTADKAGLQKGDVVTQLGKYETGDIYAYMNALSMFKPGDKTTVNFVRNGENKSVKVEF